MKSSEVTILLVEDDDVDAMAIERGFNKQRIVNTIIRAKDGKEAFDLLQRGEVQQPYVILLDLNMPRMNGLEFLTSIREYDSLKSSIVFVLTSSQADQDITASYNQHIAGYFVKSETGLGFESIVKLLDGYWKIVHFSENIA